LKLQYEYKTLLKSPGSTKTSSKAAFKQSEFALGISQVTGGTAPPGYQDAETFFARTFITEGMRLLLILVASIGALLDFRAHRHGHHIDVSSPLR
jgi:hypothetical protein